MFRNRRRGSGMPASVAARAGDGASVYQRVLGGDFAALDPRLRSYFGPIPPGAEGVGVGTFREAGLRARVLRPLFAILRMRRIAFAERGVDVPFDVRNIPEADGALRGIRTFRFAGWPREMVDRMRVVDGRLIDRLGARGELEVELAVRVVDGGLRLDSRRIALRLGGIRLPLPRVVAVSIREEACDDGTQHVEARITAPILGEIYGYAGAFTYGLRPASG
ncbi:DUF4166 domain-containing protein [Microbacterium sp.]|uniref:DUF4166 domain-containing protein n=1 Tax=Microbacterium sp. TaxID=51671 RepID=UPI0039E64611